MFLNKLSTKRKETKMIYTIKVYVMLWNKKKKKEELTQQYSLESHNIDDIKRTMAGLDNGCIVTVTTEC